MPSTAWLQHVPAIHGPSGLDLTVGALARPTPPPGTARQVGPMPVIDPDVAPVVTSRVLAPGQPVVRRPRIEQA